MPTLAHVNRISLKNILLPTDFSPTSSNALPFARTLAEIYGSSLLLTHVIPPEPHRQVVMDRVPAEDNQVWRNAQHKLEEFKRNPCLADIPCKQLLDRGDLADVIPAMIDDHAVDLVVLGTHGRRGVSKMVLGSGAEKIYRSASCPVLTVGPRAEAKGWALRCILCPVDPAEHCEPALLYALSLAEENLCEFVVFQAVPMVPWQHRLSVEQENRRLLEDLIPEQAKDWCSPQFLIRWDHPVEAILKAAEDRQADLIVMGVHKARAAGWSAHLPWPVASEVVSRSRCPVLTVRV